MLCDSPCDRLVAELLAAWTALDASERVMLAARKERNISLAAHSSRRNALEEKRRSLRSQIDQIEQRIEVELQPDERQRLNIQITRLQDEHCSLWPELKMRRDCLAASRKVRQDAVDAYKQCKKELEDAKKRYAEELAPRLAIQLPDGYQEDFKLVVHEDSVHIYFGGENRPDGLGHAHYVADHQGTITWKREVKAKRGRPV